jgi:predicted mannosyl-3-phosphoglycerate phosphatase (HAD superfamily)
MTTIRTDIDYKEIAKTLAELREKREDSFKNSSQKNRQLDIQSMTGRELKALARENKLFRSVYKYNKAELVCRIENTEWYNQQGGGVDVSDYLEFLRRERELEKQLLEAMTS